MTIEKYPDGDKLRMVQTIDMARLAARMHPHELASETSCTLVVTSNAGRKHTTHVF